MAINIPIISDFVGDGINKANKAFSKFKTEVANAEGAMNKFKAGAGVAFDTLKNNAGTFALAAGAAFTKFAVDAASKFKDLALEVDKFSTASGLAVEEASRWFEVAQDNDIAVKSLETSINKMNKTLGTSPDLFTKLGVEVAKTKDGTTDVNQTFLNVIDRLKEIKDPAERAKVATQLLGKSWTDLSQFIQQGSGNLQKSLDDVSNARIIDPDEVAKAKQFRDIMDNFKDKLEDFTLTVGEELLPVLTELINTASTFLDVLGSIGDFFSSVGETGKQFTDDLYLSNDAFKQGIDLAIKNVETMKANIKARKEYSDAIRGVVSATDELTYSEEQAEIATWQLNDAWKNLLSTLDLESSFRDAEQAIADLNSAAIEAFADPTKFDAYKDQQDAVIRKFAQIVEAMKLTDSEQNRIRFLVDTEPLEYALEALNRINLAKTGQIQPSLPRFGGARADGGPVMAGAAYLVGERGPEIFMPSSSGTILPNSTTSNANVTVNVMSADPEDTVRAIQRWARVNGNVPLATTTAVRF